MHWFIFLNLIILIWGTMLQCMLTQYMYRKVTVQRPQVPKGGWISTLSLPQVLSQYGWNILVETQNNNVMSMFTRVISVSGSAVNLLLITPEKAIKLVVNDYLRYKFTDKKWVLSWRTAITVTLYVVNDLIHVQIFSSAKSSPTKSNYFHKEVDSLNCLEFYG